MKHIRCFGSLFAALGLLACAIGTARADRLISDFNGTGFDQASPGQVTGPTFDTLSTTDLATGNVTGEFNLAPSTNLHLTGLPVSR